MALQLRIISDHRRQLGGRATRLLDAHGVTIGRASDNEWVLPDPQRYVSAHHARVHFRDGMYILEDVSTNGVYVNDDSRPVAELGAHVLANGDLIRMGEYQFIAMLEPDPAPYDAPAPMHLAAEPHTAPLTGSSIQVLSPGPEASSVQVLALPSQVDVVRGLSAHEDFDLDASLNLDELLSVDAIHATRQPQKRVDAFGHTELTGTPADTGSGHVTGTPMRLSALIADAEDSHTERRALAQRIARLARAAERAQERHAQAQPQTGDLASGLAAFCKGAGIDPATLPADAQNSLLHLAGQLFRETLLGLKDLERVRRDGAARLGITLPADPTYDIEDTQPSLVRMTVEEALTQLLAQHQGRRLDAVQWLRDTLGLASRHNEATLTAMQLAFTQFIARLDPVELQSRFQRGLHKPQGAESRYWPLFGDFYRSITEMPSGQLPHTFIDAFVAAYRDASNKKT